MEKPHRSPKSWRTNSSGAVWCYFTGRVWYGAGLLNLQPRVQIPSAPFLQRCHYSSYRLNGAKLERKQNGKLRIKRATYPQ